MEITDRFILEVSLEIIKDVFDSTKEINRRIEKVINYNQIQTDLLKNEINEYVVTESISNSLDYLLGHFERGMEEIPESTEEIHEIGVWVSGFYGSGKSSFTKYLGFALDDSIKIDGQPFLKLLQNRIGSNPLSARLATVSKKYPAAVIMVDLASDQLAGASMKEISSVLFSKIMQWAGYSKDIKIAYLEFMLEKDKKLQHFKTRVQEETNGKSWEEIRNIPLMMKTIASRIVTEFYPELWPDSKSFNEIKIEEMKTEFDRVKEIVELVKRRSGKDHIIIVLDEVGQYVSSRDDLILNLDGLAKNLKNIGYGRVWILATAQQTLTEDDPSAIMNSAKLYKLKDRFPIKVHLEAKDIKEICRKRLLGKSVVGAKKIEALFDKHGDKLRYTTRLTNTKYYKSELSKDQFINLYPFLPHHFDILLELLGRLAKSSGGVGLRSAIKIIQDILIDQSGVRLGETLLGNKSLGTLATTIDIYNTLRNDILVSYRHLVEGVEKIEKLFKKDNIYSNIGKSIAILQILENFPVSIENITSLMHSKIDTQSQLGEIKKAVSDLIDSVEIPLSEVDGNLKFMSEAVAELEKTRTSVSPFTSDIRQIFSESILNIFESTPSTVIAGTKKVICGLKASFGDFPISLSGDKEPIQLIIHFIPDVQYQEKKKFVILDSQQRYNNRNIYLLGKEDKKAETLINEIFQSRHIYRAYRHKSTDKEVSDYLKSQNQLVEKKLKELQNLYKKHLIQGSFVFRGIPVPIGELSQDLMESIRKILSNVTLEVYDKYSEAPVQVGTNTAEKFLNTESLNKIASENDPLKLVSSDGSIDLNYKACISIIDYLEKNGRVEGRKILDDFFSPPYGWQKDTTRYIISALLVGSAIKLHIGKEEIKVRGDMSINALSKTNNFSRIGISLRESSLSLEILQLASERLQILIGKEVLPIEQDISDAVIKNFPDFQNECAPLQSFLLGLSLPGIEKIKLIQEGISDLLAGDASDAANRFGRENCDLFDALIWARNVNKSIENGLDNLVKKILRIVNKIESFPDAGMLSDLKDRSKQTIIPINDIIKKEDFFDFLPDLKYRLHDLETIIKEMVGDLSLEQSQSIKRNTKKIQEKFTWSKLHGDDQEYFSNQLSELQQEYSEDIDDLERLINHEYTIKTTFENIEIEIKKKINNIIEIPAERKDELKEIYCDSLPSQVSSESDFELLERTIGDIKNDLRTFKKIKINWKL